MLGADNPTCRDFEKTTEGPDNRTFSASHLGYRLLVLGRGVRGEPTGEVPLSMYRENDSTDILYPLKDLVPSQGCRMRGSERIARPV